MFRRPPFRWPGAGPGTFVGPSLSTVVVTPTVASVAPSTDRYPNGGASITITGTNFRNETSGAAPTVKFGTVAATSVVVVDSATITCVAPAQTAPGVYSVSVTIAGQTGTLPNCFNYVASFITSITPNFAAQPGGTKAVVNGLNFLAGSTVFIDGVAATTAVVDSTTIFITIPGPHALGTVDVVVQEPGGTQTTLRNGFQYTLLNRGSDIRRAQPVAISVTQNLGQPSTASFAIDGESNKPVTGEKIVLTDEFTGRVLFAGNIVSVEQDYEERTDVEQLVWVCNAVDFTFLLNKYRPFGKFTNVSASEIVKTLIAQFAPGFTGNHVQTNLAPLSVYFDGSQDFATCLTQIATGIGGGHWYVDENQDVHFFHIAAPTLADLPGVVPGGIQLTTANGLGLLQDMSGVANTSSADTVLVN